MSDGADQDGLSSEEREGYRERLSALREVTITTAEEALRKLMDYNAGVLARIDAAIAALEPRQRESAEAHRARISAATAELDRDSFLGGE